MALTTQNNNAAAAAQPPKLQPPLSPCAVPPLPPLLLNTHVLTQRHAHTCAVIPPLRRTLGGHDQEGVVDLLLSLGHNRRAHFAVKVFGQDMQAK